MNIVFSKNLIDSLSAIYIWIIGICIGSIISAGAFSAPVIFNVKDLGVDLSKFQSGIIMTEIFLRLNTLLIFVAIIITIYEICSLKLSENTKLQKIILFLSGAISVICILLFSLYYSPFIVEQQKLGEATTSLQSFASMHTQSEITFNILFFSLSANLIFRVILKK